MAKKKHNTRHNWSKEERDRATRRQAGFTKWRKQVLARDKFTCQKCGAEKGSLEVHHIKPYKEFPELKFDVSNGLTLCRKCHQKTDDYGKKNKPEKYRKINWQVVRDQYVMRKDTPSLSALAREFKLDKAQVSRKSIADQWKKRRKNYQDAITTKVQQKATNLAVLEQTKAIQLTVGLVEKIINAIEKNQYDPDDKLSSLVGSFDKLVRLHQLLQGKPDGSTGTGSFEEFVKGLMRKRIGEHNTIEAYKKKKEQPVVIDAEVVDDGTDKP